MKTLLLLAVLFFGISQLSFAQASDTTLVGHLTDVKCGQTFKSADDAKNHTKSCALMPACAKSGYALFVDGKLIKFDAQGSKTAKKFLKSLKTERDIKVKVTGKLNGEQLIVSSIKEASAQ